MSDKIKRDASISFRTTAERRAAAEREAALRNMDLSRYVDLALQQMLEADASSQVWRKPKQRI